jgi:hypothetical protein
MHLRVHEPTSSHRLLPTNFLCELYGRMLTKSDADILAFNPASCCPGTLLPITRFFYYARCACSTNLFIALQSSSKSEPGPVHPRYSSCHLHNIANYPLPCASVSLSPHRPAACVLLLYVTFMPAHKLPDLALSTKFSHQAHLMILNTARP